MTDPVVLLGFIASAITAVVGAGIRKVWVWGWVLADMREERDWWRTFALRSTNTAEKAIDKLVDG